MGILVGKLKQNKMQSCIGQHSGLQKWGKSHQPKLKKGHKDPWKFKKITRGSYFPKPQHQTRQYGKQIIKSPQKESLE